jgi:hypothetical protein
VGEKELFTFNGPIQLVFIEQLLFIEHNTREHIRNTKYNSSFQGIYGICGHTR